MHKGSGLVDLFGWLGLIVGFLSLILTIVALIKVSNINKRIVLYNERIDFQSNKKETADIFFSIFRKLDVEKIYDVEIIENAIKEIEIFQIKYTFVGKKLKKHLKITKKFLENKCMEEVRNNRKDNRFKLCVHIQKLGQLILKEEVMFYD